MKRVGLIGVGAIGKGVLKNLIKNNCEVMAYDISEEGKANIINMGGLVANHPKEVVQFSNIIFLSLPSPQVIKELFLGSGGIAEEIQSKTTILDLSTIDPATTREMNELCNTHNSYYFDCPVSGGPAGADEGTLTIMVGGDREQFENIKEYLGYIGSHIEYIGESGLAQVLKLCHNMIGAANIVSLGEAFATGVKHGLNVKVMADIIGKSLGNSKILQYFGPNIINNTYDKVKFMLKHMHKDLSLYLKMTQEVGVPSFVGSTTFNLFHAAITNNKGSLDQTAVCQVIEDLSSVKIVENNEIKKYKIKFNEENNKNKRNKSRKLGLIGVGAIGKGVLKNLIKNNCEVMAYDISEEGKANIINMGGLVANHPKEVVQFSNIIFLSLPSPQVIKELFLGSGGIAEEIQSKTTILDLSTIDPATTREMNELCNTHNSYYFDCPVSGGPAGADEGTLTIMVGGDREQFENIKEYLGYIGSHIEYIGESGLAQVLKLCHNMIVAANIVSLGEAFATGVKHGLNIKVMADVIEKGLAGTRSLQYFGPNIINNTYDKVKFMLKHMHKDLGLYLKMTQEVGVPAFVGTSTYNLYHAALINNKGSFDHTAVCQIIEDLSSVKLVEIAS